MRARLLLVLAFAAGCSWTLPDDGGWLPLRGSPPLLDDLPHAHVAGMFGAWLYLQTGDGRIWVQEHVPGGQLVMRSLESPSQAREFSATSRPAGDGVLTVAPTGGGDQPTTHYRLTFDRLGGGANLERDLEVSSTSAYPSVLRGPGYFIARDDGDSAAQPHLLIQLLRDDGGSDSFPMGDERWVENGYLTFDDDGIGAPVLEGTPRYLLLRSLAVDPTESAVGVYDLQAHELRRLFNQPRLVDSGTISVKHHDSAFTTFDPASERVWACGQQTLAVAVATGARTDLPFDCIDFLFIGGGDVVIQSSDGTVYRIAGDSGAAMRLGQIEPFELVAAGRDWFAYTRSGSDDIGSGALSAWIGDERVIAIGVNVRVSADGTRLRWLEDAVADGQVGDLLSRELGSGAVHRLAQNVKHYSELPDGRLVAIANAAIDGAWNRAILIDEAKGESRWLAEGVQRVRVVGEEVIVAREGLDGVDSWLVPLPPR